MDECTPMFWVSEHSTLGHSRRFWCSSGPLTVGRGTRTRPSSTVFVYSFDAVRQQAHLFWHPAINACAHIMRSKFASQFLAKEAWSFYKGNRFRGFSAHCGRTHQPDQYVCCAWLLRARTAAVMHLLSVPWAHPVPV